MRQRMLALLIVIIGFQIAAAAPTDNKKSIPEDVTYKILKDETLHNIKRSVDVRLNRRVSEDVLRAIAQEIRAKDSTRYERTFIGYYLPDMKIGAGAWATTHFNPDLEVKILGSTEKEYAALQKPGTSDSKRTIIGTWFDETPYLSQKIVLYRENGTLYMESTFKDGSSRKTEMTEKKTSRGVRYEDKEGDSHGDHYILNKNGDLEIRDSEGLIAVAKKMDK